jgi:DNA-binding NtrC family response regulator
MRIGMAADPLLPPPTTQPGYRISSATPVEWALHLVYPRELSGLVIALEPGLTLGRGVPGLVPHDTVSRQHALLQAGARGLELKDLESRNGSFVDGVRATEAVPLLPQSLVRLGDVLAVVDEPPAGFDTDSILLNALPGIAPKIVRLRQEIGRAGEGAAPVLILGETGTGKEYVAAAIHERSGRSGPFVAVNCAGLAAPLFESELFGHERGAFTGAQNAREGLFRSAQGGSLLLDEVGEIPSELQAKLLRVLQEREVRPVGATASVEVDVRVLAATNRELGASVESGTFRRDLYARLAFWEFRLPPLRERRADILLWVQRFFSAWQAGHEDQKSAEPLSLAPDAAELVLLHPWPDNLRGLERLAHRLAIVEPKAPVSRAELERLLPELAPRAPAEPTPVQPSPAARQNNRTARPTREEVMAAYQAYDGNVRAMSRHFGKDRRQIYRWLKEMNIARARGRSE